MYLARQIEEVVDHTSAPSKRGYRCIQYCVELRPDGRPVWKLRREEGTWWAFYNGDPGSLRNARQRARGWMKLDKVIPHMANIGPGKLVSMAEAERLTGIMAPAALDFLRERVESGDEQAKYYVENYEKPKPEPKPEPAPPAPPTPAEKARAKQAKAVKMAEKWERAAAHAARKAKEWRQKETRHRRRAVTLESQSEPVKP